MASSGEARTTADKLTRSILTRKKERCNQYAHSAEERFVRIATLIKLEDLPRTRMPIRIELELEFWSDKNTLRPLFREKMCQKEAVTHQSKKSLPMACANR